MNAVMAYIMICNAHVILPSPLNKMISQRAIDKYAVFIMRTCDYENRTAKELAQTTRTQAYIRMVHWRWRCSFFNALITFNAME